MHISQTKQLFRVLCLILVGLLFADVVPQGNVSGGPHPILMWQAVVSTCDAKIGEMQFSFNFESFEGKLDSIVAIQRIAQ